MEKLNEVWVLINKENEQATYPEVSLHLYYQYLSDFLTYIWQPPSSTLALPAAVSTTPVNSSKTWENVFVGALAVGTPGTVSIQAKPVGKPGEWSVASFLEPA